MLSTRLWMGALLVALAAGVLILDSEPWFPFLLVVLILVALIACRELHHLLAPLPRPHFALSLAVVSAVVLANWPAHVGVSLPWMARDPWHLILGAFTAAVLAAFLVEMATFRQPGSSVVRIALTIWIVAYLGLLPSFLVQLRWLSDGRGIAALSLAIFVPKSCDIGAYFTGRLLGRHRMSPVLSPKKTWEGLAGGLALATLVAVAFHRYTPAMLASDMAAVGFGLTVGGAGVLGDLAESLIKRDCRQKDASQVLPGFGGVLDVIDAVLFAAPVAYWWLGP